MRLIVLLLTASYAYALTCTDIRATYNDKECCSDSASDTCLRALPLCTDAGVVAGQVCTDATGKAFVKGLNEALDLSDATNLLLKKHLIPDGNALLDIGNAENKIRDIFEDTN